MHESTAAGPEDSDGELVRSELRGRISDALGTLSAPQRTAVLLHDLEGWTHSEIATELRTSEGMSRQHLFNGRRRLRELLGPDIVKEYTDE